VRGRPRLSPHRTAALAAVLCAALLLPPAWAGAAGKANGAAGGVESASSGTWLAALSTTTLTFTTTTAQTSTVTNTGSIALVAVTYQVIVSTPSAGSPTFTVFACSVAWSAGKCSGGGRGPKWGAPSPRARRPRRVQPSFRL
jgi:hypothetical protein